MSFFPYYPLPGTAGGGALKVKGRPNPADRYYGYYNGSAGINVKAYVSGGVPPYTYAWTRISGSDKIGISSYSLADVGFSASNSSGNPITFIATWRITVTDSVAATDFDDVAVSINFGTSPP